MYHFYWTNEKKKDV